MRPSTSRESFALPARQRRGPRPLCDYGFDAACAQALAQWSIKIEHEVGEVVLMDQSRVARKLERASAQPRWIAAVVVSARQTIGAIQIRAEERVRGASSVKLIAGETAVGRVAS
jgi:hypothetical protein